MKILHLADTHIGYSAYNTLDENGYNQREMDVYDAFARVVDAALKEEPDIVLHAGDLFESVRPSNRAISFVIEQLLRLSDAGIPFVAISGNHSTPRLRETGSVFKVLEHIEHAHLAYRGKYETFQFGDLKIHALPHCVDKSSFESQLKKMRSDKQFRYNLAALHAGVIGLSIFRMNEFNEQLATSKQLERGFDYVALGHYHEHCEVSSSAVYSGSTERFGFGEVNQPKGFVILDLEKGKWKFHKLSIRKMLDLRVIDCRKQASGDISEAVIRNLESKDISGAIVRQKLSKVKRGEYNLLDLQRFRKLAKEALHFELRANMQDQGQRVASTGMVFDTLEREFIRFISKVEMEGMDRKAIEKRGLRYLAGGGDE